MFSRPFLLIRSLSPHHNILGHCALNGKAFGIISIVPFLIVIRRRDNSHGFYRKGIAFALFQCCKLAGQSLCGFYKLVFAVIQLLIDLVSDITVNGLPAYLLPSCFQMYGFGADKLGISFIIFKKIRI